MMQIYEWQQSSMKYAEYGGVTEAEDRQILWNDDLMGDPFPDLADWKPPCLVQYLGDENRRKLGIVGDAPSSSSLNFISQAAADALSDIWDRHALLYPVILDDVPETPYYMVVVQTELPFEGLDRKQSTGKASRTKENHFALLETWAFNEDVVGDNDLFWIPDQRLSYFVSERFKQRVIDSKLKGFCLKREFWEEKPFIS